MGAAGARQAFVASAASSARWAIADSRVTRSHRKVAAR
jgi:hypothetical protein